MIKKIFLTATLGISLMALMATSASAFPPTWAGIFWWPGSVGSDITVKACANSEQRPTDVYVTLNIKQALILYWNPAEKKGGVGVPFRLHWTITEPGQIQPDSLHGKGTCSATVIIESGDLLDNIGQDVLDDLAPNPKWHAYDIYIEEFEGIVQLFTDLNDLCEDEDIPSESCKAPLFNTEEGREVEEVVHVIFPQVTLQYNKKGEPDAYIWDPDTVDVWEYSNNDQSFYDSY